MQSEIVVEDWESVEETGALLENLDASKNPSALCTGRMDVT